MNEQQLLEKGYRKYYGEKIDVFYNRDMCVHAAQCIRGNADVFNVNRRPWIMPDAADANELAQIIDRCPARALLYILK